MTDPPPPRELRDGETWHPHVTQSVPSACQTGTYLPWGMRCHGKSGRVPPKLDEFSVGS